MKIAITAESTIDLTKELLEKYDIKTLPFTVILGDDEYKDGEITSADIFKFVEENKILPKTSAINEMQYTEFFESVLKDYDAVVHLCLSSEISSACRNAKLAESNLQNVYVVDSRSLSTGIALLAIYARELANSGKSAEEIFELCTERTKDVQASFVVKKLDYLHKGGRCSSIALLGANLLSIRPEIVLNDGKMISAKKYMGKMEKVIEKYCKDVLADNPNPDKKYAFVTYTTATDEMVNIAKSALTNVGFETIYETTAGATITSHCGENTLGVLFLNKN
ncbi:MAG: DegV family protein [Clostridia bacterium]|nr:DegV family protein [Clostridia bacterium]